VALSYISGDADVYDLIRTGPGLRFGEHDTKAPVNLLDENSTDVVHYGCDSAHRQAFASYRVVGHDMRGPT
jgi:hypothetical protein